MAVRKAPGRDHLDLAGRLLAVHPANGDREFVARGLPSSHEVAAIADAFLGVLFPEVPRAGSPGSARDGGTGRMQLAHALAALDHRLEEVLLRGLHRRCRKRNDACRARAQGIAARTLAVLPEVRACLLKDVQAAVEADPAASGPDEIVACYPGLQAIAIYRAANRLLREGAEIVPRMLTEHAKARTGVDIHPGATIGAPFFIDHGTGIVIGETACIGNSVRIYQGVTLGALSVKRVNGGELAPAAGDRGKRHPTIEDDVVIYANATILGGSTVIGRGAVVGGNTFITYSVPPGIKVGVG